MSLADIADQIEQEWYGCPQLKDWHNDHADEELGKEEAVIWMRTQQHRRRKASV